MQQIPKQKIEPLPMISKERKKVINIPCSQLDPLLDALIRYDSRKFYFILDMHKEHPEYFYDFRVQSAMVKALGAEYNELASKTEEWLSNQGEDIIPLLKKDFDPKGKEEMVRRIHILEAVAGKKENTFYLSLLKEAEGELREAVISALRHEKCNGDLLVKLAKTEKEAMQNTTHWALAAVDSSAKWEYFNKLAISNPKQVYIYMEGMISEEASTLVGKMICSLLNIFDKNKKAIPYDFEDQLQKLLDVLPGKSGPSICDFYRRAAAYGAVLDKIKAGKQAFLFCYIKRNYKWERAVFSEIMPDILTRSIVFNPDKDLVALAEELYKKYGIEYAAPAMVSALLTKDAVTAYNRMKTIVHPPISYIKDSKEEKMVQRVIKLVLGNIVLHKTENKQRIEMYFFDTSAEMNYIVEQPLAEPLDIHWYKDLILRGEAYEDILINLIQPTNKEVCEILIEYFYHRTKNTVDNEKYLIPLKELGWNKFNGMIIQYCERKDKLNIGELQQYVDKMPVSKEEKAKELEDLLKKMDNKKITVYKGIGINKFYALKDELCNEYLY